MIFINEPFIFKNEIKYIQDSLNKNWISSSGKYIDKFEKRIKSITKSKFVNSCNSGTSALQIAVNILTKKNEEVLVPSLTFISTINSIYYNRCFPIFMDSSDDFNIDENKTIKFLKERTIYKNNSTFNKITGKKISALVVVSVWGVPPKIENLYKICKKKNIKIIEDATEALGSSYRTGVFKGKHSGTVGDIGCLSFNGNKIITVGSGGMILTNKKEYNLKAQHLIKQCKKDPINYVHDDVGYNFNLPAINAAFGFGQIENLSKILKKKKQIYLHYKKKLKQLKKFNFYLHPNHSKNNFWMNMIILKKPQVSLKRKVLKTFEKKGIQARSVWFPNHLQKPFKKYEKYNITKSLKQFNSSICLPSSYSLTKKQQNKVIDLIKSLDG